MGEKSLTQIASKPLARWAWLAILPALLEGCRSPSSPAYQDARGFQFTPPAGWVERARDDALPQKAGHRPPELPLPRLGGVGGAGSERLLVRYDRLTAGHLAWLRVSVAELSSSQLLQTGLSSYAPGPGWKRLGEVESLEVSGHPAARIAFAGRWNKQDYLNETVAVRSGERAYRITASFPSADRVAREQVRQAVNRATWRE